MYNIRQKGKSQILLISRWIHPTSMVFNQLNQCISGLCHLYCSLDYSLHHNQGEHLSKLSLIEIQAPHLALLKRWKMIKWLDPWVPRLIQTTLEQWFGPWGNNDRLTPLDQEFLGWGLIDAASTKMEIYFHLKIIKIMIILISPPLFVMGQIICHVFDVV